MVDTDDAALRRRVAALDHRLKRRGDSYWVIGPDGTPVVGGPGATSDFVEQWAALMEQDLEART